MGSPSVDLRPKKFSVSVAVPPVPFRVTSQRPLSPSVASVISVANDGQHMSTRIPTHSLVIHRNVAQQIFYLELRFVFFVFHQVLFRSPNLVRVIKSRMAWTGHLDRMQERRSALKIVTGKDTGKKPLGSPRRRLQDNAKTDLKKISLNARNLLDQARDRNYRRALVNAALSLRVPYAMELIS